MANLRHHHLYTPWIYLEGFSGGLPGENKGCPVLDGKGKEKKGKKIATKSDGMIG